MIQFWHPYFLFKGFFVVWLEIFFRRHSQDENTQAMQGIVYPFECLFAMFLRMFLLRMALKLSYKFGRSVREDFKHVEVVLTFEGI